MKYLNENNGICFRLYWCKRGIWRGNINADKLAKYAVDNRNKLNIVSQKLLPTKNTINTYLKKQKLKQMFLDLDNVHNVISWNWDNLYLTYPILIDFKLLSMRKLKIINQLRTGHIYLYQYSHKLQHYKYYKQHTNIQLNIKCEQKCCAKYNGGYCTLCNKPETVIHFIFKCIRFNKLRCKYLIPIQDILMNKNIVFSLKNVLFPPSNLRWMHRKLILNNLSDYVLNTKRFVRF